MIDFAIVVIVSVYLIFVFVVTVEDYQKEQWVLEPMKKIIVIFNVEIVIVCKVKLIICNVVKVLCNLIIDVCIYLSNIVHF